MRLFQVFQHEPDHVRVVEYETKSGVKISLDSEFNRADTLNGHSPGSLILGSAAEPVLALERVDGDGVRCVGGWGFGV